MMCSLASLTPEKLQSIRAMEEKLGTPLLAYACHDLEPAPLEEEDVNMIRRLESEMGLSLVAVSNG
jgi:hypothetical protein